MQGFVRVASPDALRPGMSRAVAVGRYEVALFNVEGEYYALENACPHQGSPIVDGFIEGRTITCPWHAWCFDMRTGSLTLGQFATIPRFEVRIEQDGIYVSAQPVAE